MTKNALVDPEKPKTAVDVPKSIIICSDGTGNSTVKGRGTNVFKLYEAVDVAGHQHDPSLREQVTIYDDGVGTQKLKVLRIVAGVFGFGLARNVRQLYAELARCYRPGDQIYMFGFSRGAFTVRTLAAFVNAATIIDPTGLDSSELTIQVADEYRKYREGKPAILEMLLSPIIRFFRWLWRSIAKLSGQTYPPAKKRNEQHRIRFVGVWDTVDAVGFPVPFIAGIWNTCIYRFKFTNKSLPACVDRACHALAIDEERASFELTVWDHQEGKTEQVWFAGVHSNVGGGYPKQGMSLVALDWMMAQAEEASKEAGQKTFRIHRPLRQQYQQGQNVNDYLYDSRSGLRICYRYRPRDIQRICQERNVPVKIHDSAIQRIKRRTCGYAPGSLPVRFEVVATPGAITRGPIGNVRVREKKDPDKKQLDKNEFTHLRRFSGFSGATSFWCRWRQSVQLAFYVALVLLLLIALRSPGIPDDEQVEYDKQNQYFELGQWKVQNPTPLFRNVAESAVALVPTNFVQQRIVRPMFAAPLIGGTFLVLFPLCYFLGLLGRRRQEAINARCWAHADFDANSQAAGKADQVPA